MAPGTTHLYAGFHVSSHIFDNIKLHVIFRGRALITTTTTAYPPNPREIHSNHKVRSDEVSSDIDSVVGQLAAAMERRANKALKATGGKSSSFVVDAKDMLDRYALAVIFLITYKQADLIDFDADQDVWVNNIDTASRGIPNPVIHASMMFPFTRPLCKFLAQFHIVGKIQLEIVDYIVKATDINRVAREQHAKLQKKLSLSEPGSKERSFSEVKSTGIFKRRLVDTIIDAFLDKRIHYDNFIGSLLFLMLAGFKTTSDTIAALVWRLAKNPDIQERLRNTLWKEGIDADYVVWCINETVRLHPAVPLAAGRILGEDVELNGQFYAKGIHIMPATYSIHRDPKIWPEPERFNPDRWRDQANFHPAAFMGFGLGPRNCLGGKLAVHETKLVIRMILNNYKLEVCDKTPDEWRFSSPGLFFTLNDEPINIRFSPLAKSENSNNAA